MRIRRTFAAAVVAVFGAATIIGIRRPHVPLLVSRWLRLAGLGGRSFAREVRHRSGQLVRGRGSEQSTEHLVRTAADAAETLGNMKGAFMKAGQLLSFVDDALPEALRTALAQLQESAPPMARALAEQVVRDELGAAPRDVFKRWDANPVAAASIGQVHRAQLHDGRWVAVKVQYPGIAETMAADLAQLELGRFVVPALYPHMDVASVTGELRDRLTEELDYGIEAANQRDFATWYAGHPFIRVPEVIDGLSTSRVLTTGWAGGMKFAELEASTQDTRDVAAETIFRFVLRSLHDHLAFNGDPHPGNYRFDADGSVTFLDFGLVKRLTLAQRDGVIAEVRASSLEPDPDELRRLVETAGYFPPGNPLATDVIFRFSALLWSHVAEDRDMTLTPEWASETVRTYLMKGPEFRELDRWGGLPAHTVILQRITVGLLAVLGKLHATANWHRIAREIWFGEAPASALGEREAAWLAQQ